MLKNMDGIDSLTNKNNEGVHLVEKMRKAVLCWYEFEPKSKVLFVTCSELVGDVLDDNEDIHIYKASVEEAASKEFHEKFQGFFEYVVVIRALEKVEKPIQILKQWMRILKPAGRLLIGSDNRLGLKFFCGERDPFTGNVFDGIESYKTSKGSNIDNFFSGRCYAKHEWKEILKAANINNYKFYSVFPNLESTQLVYSENYLPNENLSIRYMPRYRDPSTVFLNEECLLSGISQSELFHLLANAFIIECSKDSLFSDIKHVTISMNRGVELACMTKIKENNTVEKQAVFKKGIENIMQLDKNMKDLAEHGVGVVGGKLVNHKYCMPYVSALTGNEYMHSQLYESTERFIELMDYFREIILKSSEYYEDDEYGAILKKGYIDLVPLNSFWIDNQFVFFDQEFCIDNLPANVILYRTIIIVYDQDPKMNELLPIDFFWKRYGMEKHMDYWIKLESDFLSQLRNQEKMIMYDNSSMRNNSIASYIRDSINSADFYEEYRESCLSELDDKKIFLFGAGKYADKFLALYKNDYNICRILDNDYTKWGAKMYNIPIASADSIVGEQEAYKVIICAKNYEPIFQQLKNMQVMHIGIYDANYVYPGRQMLEIENKKKYHIGYISGVFDLFHIGHLNMFKRAKEQCDYLIAGVTSDEYVRVQKQREPYIPFVERIEMVRACRYVDEAVEVPFQYGGTVEAFQKYHFDCQFCGSDYVNDPWWLEQKAYLQKHGSDLVFFPYTQQTSSTKIKALIEQKLL